ncbi:MAG TPA: pectinesterase family protein [Fibrobacteria bacterium]|nr:pectinesterase family protein [Fibrobacteria bacterium]
MRGHLLIRWFHTFLALSLATAESSHALARKKFDFIVGVDGDFKAALAAAARGASASNRFLIFFPDGEYDIGGLTGDANQMTTFPTSNVSFIGQNETRTVVFNKSRNEGISITATLNFKQADNLYLQDLSIMNRANYGDIATYNTTGRHVAVQEQGSKFIYKNVRLLSTQDTYYTKSTRTYWENGQIHGTTDFICGDGDVFFNGVLLFEMKKSAMTAPSTTTPWGYVFKNCIIDGDVSDFNLGRSWNTAKAVFLNTTMRKLPAAAGWGDPMNTNPQVFAEYRSITASGSLIDLSRRRGSYAKGVTVTLNPVLTDAEAARYTVANVLSGNDNWQPQNLVRQVAAPVVSLAGSQATWADDPDALGWVVFRNGKYLANVVGPAFDVSTLAAGDLVTVRAANSMGGLGAASVAVKVGTPTGIAGSSFEASRPMRVVRRGHPVFALEGFGGAPVEVTLRDAGGATLYRERLAGLVNPPVVDLSALGLASGLYFATAVTPDRPTKAFLLRIDE